MKKQLFSLLLALALLLAAAPSALAAGSESFPFSAAEFEQLLAEPLRQHDMMSMLDTEDGDVYLYIFDSDFNVTGILMFNKGNTEVSSTDEHGIQGIVAGLNKEENAEDHYQMIYTMDAIITAVDGSLDENRRGEIMMTLAEEMESDLSSDSPTGSTSVNGVSYTLTISDWRWFLVVEPDSSSYRSGSTTGSSSGGQSTGNEKSTMLQSKNALSQAQSYLRYSAFSHDGLVEQLEYEGYGHSEAVYAADHCGADWNEQALKSAESYLKYLAFSYSGLIEQLEYEKFTHAQAVYAVDHCGADWFEQAAKSAASYLKYSSFSRSELISQLEFEGFTHEQAVYGVNQNGL